MDTKPVSKEEQDFLASYDPGKYERPSVTVDIILMTVNTEQAYEKKTLSVLLVKRGGFPQKGYWALPGGFLNAGKESTEEAALRELREETGVDNAFLNQLYTFSNPNRDPRTHVVSVAYLSLLPFSCLSYRAGDDAADTKLFDITEFDEDTGHMTMYHKTEGILHENDLAFDHAEIIRTAIRRLRGRIHYEPDAFELLEDRHRFTIYELKTMFEAILDKQLDTSNFRKMFQRAYLKTKMVSLTGEKGQYKGNPAAALYCLQKERKTV